MRMNRSIAARLKQVVWIFCLGVTTAHAQETGWFMRDMQPVTSEAAETYFQSHAQQKADALYEGEPNTPPPAGSSQKMTITDPTDALFDEAFGDDIAELARGLQNDPVQIFAFVRNHMVYEPYFGALKGATMTLRDRGGNDFDQASLLMALLEEAGYAPHYVYGTMTIPVENGVGGRDFIHWLGIEPSHDAFETADQVLKVLSNGGIPIGNFDPDSQDPQPIPADNGEFYLSIARVWVRVDINGTTYNLDPAFKTVSKATSTIDIATASGFDEGVLLNSADATEVETTDDYFEVSDISLSGLEAKLTENTSTLLTSVRSTYYSDSPEQVLGQYAIDPQTLTELPASLPFAFTESAVWSEVPAQYLHTLRIEAGAIRETVATQQLTGRKLSVHFEGGHATQKPQSTSGVNYAQSSTEIDAGSIIQSDQQSMKFGLGAGAGGQSVDYLVELLDSGNGAFQLLDSAGSVATSVTATATNASPASYHVRFRGFDDAQSALLLPGVKQGLVKITILTSGVVFDTTTNRVDALLDIQGQVLSEPSVVISLDDQPILGDDVVDFQNSLEYDFDDQSWKSTRKRVRVTIDHPYADDAGTAHDATDDYLVQSAGTYVLGMSFGRIAESTQLARRAPVFQAMVDPNSTATETEKLTESLYRVGLTWLDQTARVANVLEGASQHLVQRHHRIGLIGQVEGYFVDFRTQSSSFSHRIAGQARSEALFRSQSYLSSALEHGVLEQLQGADQRVASTISVIAQAVAEDQAINVYEELTPDAADALFNVGGYGAGFINARASEINGSEFSVLILPAERGQINAWEGEGYIGYRPTSSGVGRVLMGISGDSVDGTLGGGFSTLFAPLQSQDMFVDSILDTTTSSFGYSTSSIGCGPVNFNTGDKLETMTDLSVGSLSFSRRYNSGTSNQDAGLGLGWRHSLDITANLHSDEASALGGRAVSDMAPILVAQLAIQTLLADEIDGNETIPPSAEDWVIATLVANWAVKQLQDNAVTIRGANSADTYLKMPDGTFNAPPQNTSVLSIEADKYVVTGRFGTVTRFNTDHQIESITDVDGNALTFSYLNGVLDQVQDDYANTLSLSYLSGKLDQVQDHSGRSVSFDYVNDRLETVTDVEGKVWTYEYDTEQRLMRRVNPLSEIIKEMDYDPLGRVARQRWPREAGVAEETYFYGQFATTITDPLDHPRQTRFDRRLRTTESVNALAERSTRAYDGQSRVILSKDALDRESTAVFDEHNNLRQSINTAQETTLFDYDSALRLETITDPLGHQSRTQYDAEHHPTVATVYPSASETISVTTTYHPNGRIDTVTDAKNAVTTHTYDARQNPDTQSTTYPTATGNATTPPVDWDYDALGRLETLTDQAGAETSFTYDNRNNVETITDPQGEVTTLTYDDAGRLKTVTDRNGVLSEVFYTISGQVDLVDYPGTAEDVSFDYDLRDQVETMTDVLGVTTYDYDELGRLYDVIDPNGFTVGYRYNAVGLLETLIYPGNKQVSYTYDMANRLKTMTNWLNETVTHYYDLAGRMDYTVNANGTITDYQFDDANRLTRLTNKKANGEVISEQVYTLDGNGNPESEFRIQPQGPQEIAVDFSYQYNANKTRLETVTNDDTNTVIATFGYDDEGQQTAKDANTRIFDARHRLTQQGNKTYVYDGNNNRLMVTTGTDVRYFVYDAANNLLAEADANKVITRYYVHAQGLNQMIQGTDSYTYHFSATGHTLAMTDDQETVVNQYAYSPFGRILGDLEGQGLEQPFKYVGKYGVQHENDAIYYMRARYYDAELGRFLKEDPIGFEGGLNVSLYVGGNPIVGVDPSGLIICGPFVVQCIGGAVGFAVEAAVQISTGDFSGTQLLVATAAGAVGGAAGNGIAKVSIPATANVIAQGATATGRLVLAGAAGGSIAGAANTANNLIEGNPAGQGLAAAVQTGIEFGMGGQVAGEVAQAGVQLSPLGGSVGNLSQGGVIFGDAVSNIVSNGSGLLEFGNSDSQCFP